MTTTPTGSMPGTSPGSGAAHEFSGYPEVRAALADPRLVPPPAETGPPGTTDWLRATVSRFASGAAHARRRALTEAEVALLDPAALRVAAERAAAADDGRETRLVVVGTLAEALGLADPEAVADAVATVAGAYFGGAAPETLAASDAAVAWLAPRMLPGGGSEEDPEQARGQRWEERVAGRIGLLIQACDATAALVDHARQAGCPAAGPDLPAALDRLVTETMRVNPPLRTMRRVAARATEVAGCPIAEGDLVLLDVVGATAAPEAAGELLTFGAPPRACPGQAQALALAAGILAGRAAAADGQASE
ncbi:cytochrome P450 [Streptacidiphilus sp. P02-A3a]|uniref:cytochrome P450 n=1 Tax=Streptacidiphilus sp. P02-A3a TaxID=2704468 RepID=UPI001CDD2883|nr:cytochrome P450 [Streptacidiphilus sp. P02-A3a]